MAYGSGFLGNLPPWNPMGVQTPPPVANPTTAPGAITDYSANQLRMLQGSNSGQMPAGGAARPPVSMQAPINNSVGQMTPRSAGIGGAVSPNANSLTKFDNFLRPNAAFTPQATVNTPGLVEGMANTPRSMPPLSSGSVPPSAYSSFLASGGVLPPEAPKPTVDLSAMRGNPGSTVGYSMGGGQPPRSPGAPFAMPPSAGGGGDMGAPPPDAGDVGAAAGGFNTFKNVLTGGSLTGMAARSPLYYVAGNVAKQGIDAAMDYAAGRPNATLQASVPYKNEMYKNWAAGNTGAAALDAALATGATAKEVGRGVVQPITNFVNSALGEWNKFSPSSVAGVSAPLATPPAPPPIAPPAPPIASPPASGDGPRTVTVAPQNQSLSAAFPDRFKGVQSFASAVSGSNNRTVPLTAQQQNFNEEVLRGMQLENRTRELANVDRYRATQLGDRRALQTLAASDGRGLGQGLEREQQDDQSGKLKGMREGISMLDERRKAVNDALFDPNNASAASKINSARIKQQELNTAREAMGLPALTLEEMVSSTFGKTYDPKSGYFKNPK